MKRILFIIILLLCLVACNNTTITSNDAIATSTNNEIIYDQMNTDIKFLKEEATCTTRAIYYYSSITGEIGSDTFEYGEALGHDFVNNVCERCNLYDDGIKWGELH